MGIKPQLDLDQEEQVLFFQEMVNAFFMSPEEIDMLKQNDFIVLNRMGTDDILDAYGLYWQRDLPVFVTTDAILQVWHLLFDNLVKKAEEDIYFNLFKSLVKNMVEQVKDSLLIPNIDNATLYTGIYLYTAIQLAEPSYVVPSKYAEYVSGIVQTILDGKSIFELPPIFNNQPLQRFTDDFSQYIPRGHYDSSETLKSYFRLFKWLSNIPFFFDYYPGISILNTSPEDMVKSTIQLTYALKHASVVFEKYNIQATGFELLNYFTQFLDSLIGHAYIVSPLAVDQAVIRVTASENWNLTSINQENLLTIQQELLNDPNVPSPMSAELVDKLAGSVVSPKTFHFFGFRLGLDDLVLNHLVYPYYSDSFPNSLEIAASVFGSERARYHLNNISNVTGHIDSHITGQIESWKSKNNMTISTSWFDSLSTLTAPTPSSSKVPNPTYPSFFSSDAWKDEKLTTILGSYAQYKHDTILYSQMAGGINFCETPYGYVEPYPEFYGSLAQTNRLLNQTFAKLDVLGLNFSSWGFEIDYDLTPFDVIRKFDSILSKLKEISLYELKGDPLPEELCQFLLEIYNVVGCGDTLEGWLPEIVSIVTKGLTRDVHNSYPDSRTSLVADIFSEPNYQQNLAVATGYLEHVIAKVNLNGTEFYAVGPVYSFYEFRTPWDVRMTDNEWRGILSSYTYNTSYDYDYIPRGFWAKSYMTSTEMTAGHIFDEVDMDVPDWFINSQSENIISNYNGIDQPSPADVVNSSSDTNTKTSNIFSNTPTPSNRSPKNNVDFLGLSSIFLLLPFTIKKKRKWIN